MFIPYTTSITVEWSDIVSQNTYSWLDYKADEVFCAFIAISQWFMYSEKCICSTVFLIKDAILKGLRKQNSILNLFSKKSDNVNININMNNYYSLLLHSGLPLFLMSNKYIKILIPCIFVCFLLLW